MTDSITEQTEDEIVRIDVTDEALEAAAFVEHSGVYTQMGLCTLSYCTD